MHNKKLTFFAAILLTLAATRCTSKKPTIGKNTKEAQKRKNDAKTSGEQFDEYKKLVKDAVIDQLLDRVEELDKDIIKLCCATILAALGQEKHVVDVGLETLKDKGLSDHKMHIISILLNLTKIEGEDTSKNLFVLLDKVPGVTQEEKNKAIITKTKQVLDVLMFEASKTHYLNRKNNQKHYVDSQNKNFALL